MKKILIILITLFMVLFISCKEMNTIDEIKQGDDGQILLDSHAKEEILEIGEIETTEITEAIETIEATEVTEITKPAEKTEIAEETKKTESVEETEIVEETPEKTEPVEETEIVEETPEKTEPVEETEITDIEVPIPTEIMVYVYEYVNGKTVRRDQNSINVYVGSKILITVTIGPEEADDSVIMYVNDNNIGVMLDNKTTFDFNRVTTYSLKFASYLNTSLESETITINVLQKPVVQTYDTITEINFTLNNGKPIYGLQKVYNINFKDNTYSSGYLYEDVLAVKKTFSEEEELEFIKGAESSKLLSLEKKYQTSGLVCDGSGWDMVISFKDGSSITSSGYEFIPDIFALIAPYINELCGEDWLPKN